MTVEFGRRGNVATIVLDRPERLNALSFDLLGRLDEALDRASDARAVVVTGAGGRAFCAGADVGELRRRTLAEQRRGIELGQRVFAKLNALSAPSVAVINGYAFGGGLELALACTFRLALPNAKMGLPEIKLGLIPGYGGTQRLPRVVGEARALEMIMTGRAVEAAEAARIGLVSRVVEGDPMEEGVAFAGRFARHSLPVLEFARQAVTRALDTPLHEGLKIEADLATLAYRTADAEEGMAAFEEKREPEFRDA